MEDEKNEKLESFNHNMGSPSYNSTSFNTASNK